MKNGSLQGRMAQLLFNHTATISLSPADLQVKNFIFYFIYYIDIDNQGLKVPSPY